MRTRQAPSFRPYQAHSVQDRLPSRWREEKEEGRADLRLGFLVFFVSGDMTAALALAVGPSGHVVAIDPAAGDYGASISSYPSSKLSSSAYPFASSSLPSSSSRFSCSGSPFTLADTQDHLSKSSLGSRITFHLETSTEAFIGSRNQLSFK